MNKYLITVIIASLVLASCSKTKEDFNLSIPEENALYNEAIENIKANNFKKSGTLLATFNIEYPLSKKSENALVLEAYAKFRAGEFDEAIVTLDEFISLNPQHNHIDYIYYLRAMIYYKQVTEAGLDQQNTLQARIELLKLIERFPNSKYAHDAKIKLNLVNNFLAAAEMDIAKFYYNKNILLSAFGRYKTVLANYSNTLYVEEALYRMVEISLILGMNDEAKTYAAILGANYQSGNWYKLAFNLIGKD